MSTRTAGPAALRSAAVARAIGAMALIGIAADHLYEYRVDHYSAIPTIGTLFLLNGLGAISLAVVLMLPLTRLLGTVRARLVQALASAAGITLAATTLGGLLIAESRPLFGFMEVGYRPVVVLSIIAEGVAIAALGAFLGLLRVGAATVAAPAQRKRGTRYYGT